LKREAPSRNTATMPDDAVLTSLDSLVASPFARLAELLKGIEPGAKPIDASLGEPKGLMPPFLGPMLQDHLAEFGRYPPIRGVPSLRQAITDWMGRRYPLLAGQIDPERHVLPLNGSREGLFSAVFPAIARKPSIERPSVLIPNPFYQAYAAAAAASGAAPHFLASTAETGFLPEFDAIDEDLLQRTIAFYLCSPSNPQGAVASRSYLAQAIALARAHDFLLFADECYSEIYGDVAPPGALETAYAETGSLANVVVFQSLSKRSGLPGLRSGFVAGDPDFIAAFGRFRNVACPQVPLPIQHVSVAAWSDEEHVEQGRALYRANFDLADAILGSRYGYQRPGGAFFLWLDLADFGGGEGAATTLWKDCGVKVLPGAYLARAEPDGDNPGRDYVRVALVHDTDTTREALTRIVATLG
jgi:N-succinyldiaminopimelate aminotransferase